MLRDLEILDIDYSAADASYRETETHKVSELDGRILIPYKGPMYARNLVVRADGTPLTIETDYTFEDDYPELEMMTGKKVVGSLRFSAKVLTDYKEIKIVYQRFADILISRQYLLDSIDKILNSDTEIDWVTQVFGKPDSYPPSAHSHDISSKDEMVGFSDLVVLFKQAQGETKQDGLTLWNKLKTIEAKYFKSMNDTYTALWNKIFAHIMNVNNPHGVTKAQLELGSHPNYGTATLAQDYDAWLYKYDETNVDSEGNPTTDKLASNVISTPAGLRYALSQFEQKTDGYFKQGSLPFSYYGSAFYIPPSISGSFEGLGTNSGGAAICMESNGKTVLLTRGFDSKVKQLYYYVNDNIFDEKGNFSFTGYAYKSQLMENAGYTPNHCLSGSNERILVIGDKEAGQYYICLANGTLDADSHNLVKIDMGSFKDADDVDVWGKDSAYVFMVGDYVYIVGSQASAAGSWPSSFPQEDRDIRGTQKTWRRCAFFRINKTDLDGSKKEVSFVRQQITYQNSEGEWLYNQDNVNFCKDVWYIDEADGIKKLKRLVYEFTQPPNGYRLGDPWRRQYITVEDPSRKNIAAMRLFHSIRYTFSTSTVSKLEDWHFCLPYEFDANTNTLTLDSRFFHAKRDPETSTNWEVPENRDKNEWYNGYISRFITSHSEQAATWAAQIGYCGLRTSTTLLPYGVQHCAMGLNPNHRFAGLENASEYELFNQNLINLGTGNDNKDLAIGVRLFRIPLDSPFGFTSKPNHQRDLWYYNGKKQDLPLEIFCALNQGGSKSLWYRETKDSIDYNPGDAFNFKYIDNTVYGRPPSTKFGNVTVNGREYTHSSRTPCMMVNSRDKYGVQYGMFTTNSQALSVNSKTNNKEIVIGGSIHYPAVNTGTVLTQRVLLEEGWELTLLADHSYNADTKVLTVTPLKEETLHISKENLLTFLKAMIGDAFSEICTEDGMANQGEWGITVYFGQDKYPSFAQLIWHRTSDPKPIYGVFCQFDWSDTGLNDDGYRNIEIKNIRSINDKYAPNGLTVVTSNLSIGSTGKWGMSSDFSNEMCLPVMFLDYTDDDNFSLWLSSGISYSIPGNAGTDATRYQRTNGNVSVFSYNINARYNAVNLPNLFQLVDGYGLTVPVSPTRSGGAALYVNGGNIPDGVVLLLQAVFIEGNWTLFINTKVTATFNGSVRTLNTTNYDLSELGTTYKNQTFYLYAMSGKTEGYYDLTKSKRTSSPYSLLAAIIRTNAFGIEEIKVEQRFAVSGFSITTENRGGSIPATSGTFPEEGTFSAVVIEDLFDSSTY